MKKPANERTSKDVARIAGKVLSATLHITNDSTQCRCAIHDAARALGVTVTELKALAASCLTQAPDKPNTKK